MTTKYTVEVLRDGRACAPACRWHDGNYCLLFMRDLVTLGFGYEPQTGKSEACQECVDLDGYTDKEETP